MPNVIKHRRVVSSKDPDVLSLLSDVDKLKNNEIKITYFEPIISSTGTVTAPGQATILLDQFEGGVDAYVSTISGGKPTGEFPVDSSGNQVDVSYFDALGNYTLTSTPTVFPVALIYVFKTKLIDYQNVDLNYIIEEDEINSSTDLEGLKTIKKECGELIPAYRALVLISDKVFLFDHTDLSHYNKCIGFSNQSGNAGDFIDVVISGEVNTALALIDGAVYYAGTNGSLVNIAPATGIMQSVAVATSINKLLIKLTQPIIKN